MSPQRLDYLEMHYNNCIVWLCKYGFIKNIPMKLYYVRILHKKKTRNCCNLWLLCIMHKKLLLSAEERLNLLGSELYTNRRQKFWIINSFLLYSSTVRRHKNIRQLLFNGVNIYLYLVLIFFEKTIKYSFIKC